MTGNILLKRYTKNIRLLKIEALRKAHRRHQCTHPELRCIWTMDEYAMGLERYQLYCLSEFLSWKRRRRWKRLWKQSNNSKDDYDPPNPDSSKGFINNANYPLFPLSVPRPSTQIRRPPSRMERVLHPQFHPAQQPHHHPIPHPQLLHPLRRVHSWWNRPRLPRRNFWQWKMAWWLQVLTRTRENFHSLEDFQHWREQIPVHRAWQFSFS